MRIRIDLQEMQAMAETLQAGATVLAEVGADVCSCDLPIGVAAVFEHYRSPLKQTFDELATAYRLHASILLLRALIATKDVNKAVAVFPPTAPATPRAATAPAVGSSTGSRGSSYDPSKYYVPGSAAYNRLTADEKKMNNAIASSITMPMVMANYRKSSERLDASMSSIFEPSSFELEQKLGRIPTMADRQYYTPNTYKAQFGDF